MRRRGVSTSCPLSTQIKDYPFEVLTVVGGVASAVLSDQVKSLDWRACKAKKKGRVSATVVQHVRAKIKALLVID